MGRRIGAICSREPKSVFGALPRRLTLWTTESIAKL